MSLESRRVRPKDKDTRKRIALARPTYGHTDPYANKALNISMMTAARHHVIWEGDVSHDRAAWAHTRNMSAHDALMIPGLDGVLWVDDDMVPSSISIAQLVTADKDFVSGLCFSRRAPYRPTFARGNMKDGYVQASKWPEDALIQVDAVGFGFVYTSMALIRAVGPKPFSGNTGGEDYRFCAKAIQCGYHPWVDTGCYVGHLGDPQIVDHATYLMHRNSLSASATLPGDSNPEGPDIAPDGVRQPLDSEPESVN